SGAISICNAFQRQAHGCVCLLHCDSKHVPCVTFCVPCSSKWNIGRVSSRSRKTIET
ncbi:hypothetical protein HDU99_004396, partial [Rhizoclosmatium hyalinum]